MRLPEPISGMMSGARNAKYKADRASSQAKRAGSTASRAKDKASGSKQSKSESEVVPQPEAPTQPEQAPESEPPPAYQPEVAPQPDLEQDSRSPAVLFAVMAMLGAILAVLLGLAVANNSGDRALFALIGVPLGAVLAIVVLISYGWAGLIDQPD
jgi:cobalamin biosynthesis Mg chelatase CobN